MFHYPSAHGRGLRNVRLSVRCALIRNTWGNLPQASSVTVAVPAVETSACIMLLYPERELWQAAPVWAWLVQRTGS